MVDDDKHPSSSFQNNCEFTDFVILLQTFHTVFFNGCYEGILESIAIHLRGEMTLAKLSEAGCHPLLSCSHEQKLVGG